MRIKVKENSRWALRLSIPTWLFLNRFTAFIISRGDKDITYKQAWTLFRAIKTFRRRNGKWKLVEVHSADGDEVEITI